MTTAVYSGLHFLVDFLCAYAMFGRFIPGPDGYLHILLYNFCAFAMQMPLGVTLDLLSEKSRRFPRIFAGAGVALTIAGIVTHPAVLGIGNALFHVGGGVSVIREDRARGWRGQALGIFVAPGALGLYLGKGFTGNILPVCLVMVLLAIAGFFPKEPEIRPLSPSKSGNPLVLTLCCFLVVILRSHVGMAVSFSWKSGAVLGTVSVIAVVLGKMTGGILAARLGTNVTVLGSLILAAACYALGEMPAFGIAALFFFNMTMPITLYLLVQKWQRLPGFSFGLLTFGLFLGFLPTYFEWNIGISGPALGAMGSLVSLALLLPAWKREAIRP